MSTNLPEQQPSEEIDLGQLFKLIGNAFERFFRFIGSIFNKLFLAFVWFVFFTKRHFLKFVIIGAVGVLYGIIKQKISKPLYTSTIIVKQNYDTGEHFYNTIKYYNSLITEKDTISLGELLKVEASEASNLFKFEIESVLSENQKIQLFNDYTKGLDSTLAETIEFKDFSRNSNDFEHKLQKINLKSYSKNNFDTIFNQVVRNITTHAFFKNEQEKDLEELLGREKAINESLEESDSLQKVYQQVLKESAQKVPGGNTSITFEGADDKSVTKEFELYEKNLELRRELVEIQRKKEDLAHIIEIVSRQQDVGTMDNKGKLFGFETNKIISFTAKLILLALIILLLLEFVRFLERYKDKV